MCVSGVSTAQLMSVMATHAVKFKVKGQGGHLLRQLILSFDYEHRWVPLHRRYHTAETEACSISCLFFRACDRLRR